jgi:hypothetical protein
MHDYHLFAMHWPVAAVLRLVLDLADLNNNLTLSSVVGAIRVQMCLLPAVCVIRIKHFVMPCFVHVVIVC